MKQFVSVIIPVFNGSPYLRETVRSIQKSTYKYFEIILVDDGSTDESKHICEQIEKEYPNVRFFSFVKHEGMGRILNFALHKARGKYIARINQDDRMLPHRLQTQVSFLENNPEVVAVGSNITLFTLKNENNQRMMKFLETDDEIKKFWLLLSPFSDPSVMYQKGAALAVDGYEQEFWPADDVHMWYKMGRIGKLANIQEPLVEVRWHKDAGSLKFFRRNTIVTYKLHRWAHSRVQKANLLTQLFWLGQLTCGLILPASFNWSAYRLIKRFLINMLEKSTVVAIVANQPKTLSRSGV